MAEVQKTKEENRRLVEQVESTAGLADLMGSVTSLLSNMPALSFSKDAKTGVYLACNQAFAEYAHKKRPEEVVGLTAHLSKPVDPELLYRTLDELIAQQEKKSHSV